ncbi:hypothetical protein GE09DRAFT_1098838 [Coniochaeta sp. 2T2.1]|nr:hypothetical protein GE09DRAFT_1098838 [Coniochaeta sp. 2T2.1]
MARTRAQTGQKPQPSSEPKNQGKRTQGVRKSAARKRGRLQEQPITKRTGCNRPSRSATSQTSSQQNLSALVHNRGRKRQQSIEHTFERSPNPDPKRQRASCTPPAEAAFGGLLSRKREVDNTQENILPRAKRVQRAKGREHTLQEQAGSDQAEFQSHPTGQPLNRKVLEVSVECKGQKPLRVVADPLKDTSDEHSRKRRRTSLGQQEAASGDIEDWRDIIDYWRREGSWPKKYFEQDDYTRKDFEKESEEDTWLKEMERYDPTVRLLFAKKKASTSLSRKRSGSNSSTTPSQDTISARSMTPSDQKPREEKSAPYRNAQYPLLLQTKGSYMGKSPLGITAESRSLCKILLDSEQPAPKESLFDDDVFESVCDNVENKNEARVIQDISRLIVPSVEQYALHAKHLKHLTESVNEGWNNSIPLTGTRPQPDYSVGFRREAFTEDQLAKLSPFIGNFIAGDQSFFMATYYMYFPFLTCEVKCGAAALDIADRQNAHSMTLAVRAIVELFRAVKREEEVNRQILAFSISHDHRSVRIYGHYPVLEGKDTKYYRHAIRTFDFTELDGRDKWTAYRFTKNVYDIWMHDHFKNICSAIDQLPSDLDFDVPSLSEATGLSQDLGNLMQSDVGSASVPVEGDSQSSNAEQPADTPDTSFTRPEVAKRRKGQVKT